MGLFVSGEGREQVGRGESGSGGTFLDLVSLWCIPLFSSSLSLPKMKDVGLSDEELAQLVFGYVMRLRWEL